jgi:FKBP-type peptidyl-prolyl cis-trans isomerase
MAWTRGWSAAVVLALVGSAWAQTGQPAAAPAGKGEPEKKEMVPVEVQVINPGASLWAIPTDAKPVKREERAGGLVVEDYVLGEGVECQKDWGIVVHSRGTLKANGQEFDTTYAQGLPIVAPLVSAIAGIREGVPGMKVGGKRRLIIPASMAYGDKGSPPKDSGRPQIVPPNADLVFDITLMDVLQIEDQKVGEGEEVRYGATVTCHYTGTLKLDGTKFDSSHDRGKPAEFSLRQVIPGWQYGIPGMKVGGKRKLIVPWAMAYGERGVGGQIPPKADLVFEVEVLGVQNPPPPPTSVAPAVVTPSTPAPAKTPAGGEGK